MFPDKEVYTEWVTGSDNVMIDLNKGCSNSGSKQIYIAVGRNYVNKEPTGMIESNETHHAGTIVMNSKGKVQVGEIYNNGEYNNTIGFRSGTDNTLYNAANFYGTPSIEVNSGLFSVDTYLGFHEVDWLGKIQNIDDSDPVNHPTTRPTDYPANYDFFYKVKNLIFYNFYGNDTIGKVTVNGGILQIGANGTATLKASSIGNSVNVNNVTAVFKPVYTLTINQVEQSLTDKGHFAYAYDSDGEMITDANPKQSGIQLFEGEQVTLSFKDYDGGYLFNGFTLTYDDGTTQTLQNNEQVTITRNMEVSYSVTSQP
ncbi:MAG: hypothetical protein ACI4XP_07375 [Acutalibacteraceae bacterium]